MSRATDLWHAAGRAARDDRKRLLALQGLLWSGPLLVLGSLLARLPDPALVELRRPLAYVLDPLRQAWLQDKDLALLGYVGLQFLLLALLWGLFGGAIHRLAAVDLGLGRREDGRAALSFARRHWRGFVGSRVALWLGVAAPLAAAALFALLGRLGGWPGGILLALAVGVAVLLALAAAVVASVDVAAGFLTGPTVACEDSDAFDAVSRTFQYAGADLPRLTLWRLGFMGGVLLGSLWRLLRTALAAGLALLALRAGTGDAALSRALAILGATGTPPDAARLAIGPSDYLVAVVLAFALGTLFLLWCADLLSRGICARTAVYLLVRQRVDRVPLDEIRTRPRGPAHRGADEAGFVEVGRIGADGA